MSASTSTDPRVQRMADLSTPDGFAEQKLGMALHPKHRAVLKDVFRNGSRVVCRCGNGVGKTSTLAVAAIHYQLAVMKGYAMSTAGVWRQVSKQLIPKLKLQARKFPKWEYLDTGIKVDGIQKYLGFSAADDGTAQGFHESNEESLLAIIDEAAAVDDPIFDAIEERCDPTFLLIVGSPLDPKGRFYEMEHRLARYYSHHHISQFDCLREDGYWIDRFKIERKIAKYGRDHPLVLSNVFGEFGTSIENALLTLMELNACLENPPAAKGGDQHLFVDVAGGGDKNVAAYRRGNVVRIVKAWRQYSEMATIGEIIAIQADLKKEQGLRWEEVSIDASGAGKPMADRLEELGYPINRFNGQGAVRFDQNCYNARAEVWCNGTDKIKQCLVNIEDNEDLRMQLLQWPRKRHSSGKFLIKSKEDGIKDGLPSPDEADAVLGCMMPAPVTRSISLVQPHSDGQQWSDGGEDAKEGRRYFD